MYCRAHVVVLVASLTVSGCVFGRADTSLSELPQRSRLTLPAERTTVVEGETDHQLAVAASRALYQRAPAVLLAADGHAAGVRRAAAVAADWGVPLLLTPPHEAFGGTAGALRTEINRLAPAAIVSFGTTATDWARKASTKWATVSAPTDRERLAAAVEEHLPEIERPARLDSLLVLVSRDHAAAAATAAATGARVVPTDSDDPRADPDAIAALARQRPDRVLALGGGFGPAERLRHRVEVAATGVELPGGGQRLCPGRRMVALYGHPGDPGLGVLGEQPVEAAVARARRVAGDYQGLVDEPVVPAFEIITTVASSSPGPDGDYSAEASVAMLRPWVDAARDADMYVMLDLQPGHTDFLTQAKRYEDLLAEPHVGLALDPEWRLAPGQRHMVQIGSVDADEVNTVIDWLADLTRERKLPQKLVMLHQFRLSMITDRDRIDTTRDELTVLIHADGFGTPGEKYETWQNLKAGAPPDVWWGWKNFYDEDRPTFTPAQTMALKPSPVFVSYQ